MEFEKQLEEWMKLDYVLPEDLPNIELYMDPVSYTHLTLPTICSV